MTKEEFRKQGWGAGMIVKYENENYVMQSDVVSVDFENDTIGLEMPLTKDIEYFPCEKCTIIKDFVYKGK